MFCSCKLIKLLESKVKWQCNNNSELDFLYDCISVESERCNKKNVIFSSDRFTSLMPSQNYWRNEKISWNHIIAINSINLILLHFVIVFYSHVFLVYYISSTEQYTVLIGNKFSFNFIFMLFLFFSLVFSDKLVFPQVITQTFLKWNPI